MSEVEFQEENLSNSAYYSPSSSGDSKMVKMVIGWGLAKDKDGANKILLVAAVIFFIAAIYFAFF